MPASASLPVLLDVRLGDDDGFVVCATLTRATRDPRPELAVLPASTDPYEGCDELMASCGARGLIRKTRLIDTDPDSSGRAPDSSQGRISRQSGRRGRAVVERSDPRARQAPRPQGPS